MYTVESDQVNAMNDDSHEAHQIYIMVCKGFSGQIVRTSVSIHDTVAEALPLIADQIQYYSPDYDNIGLYNLTRDFEYQLSDRFCDRGTAEGDLLVMADGAGCHKE